MKLYIHSQALLLMQSHALDTFPYECCGFFYGSVCSSRIEVREARRVSNRKAGDQRRRFEVSARDYMDAERYALLNRLDLLGVYHSHPLHPANPSEHDLRQALPNFSYIILALDQDEIQALRSWRLNDDGQFIEEGISLPLQHSFNQTKTLNT